MENIVQPQEELLYIRKIMAESRGQVADDGKPSIIWGLIVCIGLLFTYYEAVNGGDIAGWIWLGLSVCGWIYMFGWVRRKRQRQRVRTFADRITGAIWGSVGISITLFVFETQISYLIDRPVELHPIFIAYGVSFFLAIGYYISGILYEIPWLKWFGIGWWAVAIVFIFWPGLHTLLIYAGAELFLQVLPGILLLRKYQSTQRS